MLRDAVCFYTGNDNIDACWVTSVFSPTFFLPSLSPFHFFLLSLKDVFVSGMYRCNIIAPKDDLVCIQFTFFLSLLLLSCLHWVALLYLDRDTRVSIDTKALPKEKDANTMPLLRLDNTLNCSPINLHFTRLFQTPLWLLRFFPTTSFPFRTPRTASEMSPWKITFP